MGISRRIINTINKMARISAKQERYEYERKGGFKNCPNCGKRIKAEAIRCKYCKIMFVEY